MRLSTRGKYALEALVFLGLECKKGNELISLSSISESTGISDGYLEQLFSRLKKDKLISSQKGKYGGYCLGKNADQIMVGDILVSTEGPLSLVRCSESENCERKSWCLTHKLWNAAYSKIENTINSITLANLVDDYEARLKKEGRL